ncbi:hypothetical protein, partial [Solidesulfovibrio aerotolerans]|uniref:hypothetical protein n=1 Tax=Solidesulfovibrio aerotolerans TaxID=295255 RepID=UPI001BA76035
MQKKTSDRKFSFSCPEVVRILTHRAKMVMLLQTARLWKLRLPGHRIDRTAIPSIQPFQRAGFYRPFPFALLFFRSKIKPFLTHTGAERWNPGAFP